MRRYGSARCSGLFVMAVVLLFFASCTPNPGTGGTTTTVPSTQPLSVIGYFTEWGIYARNFQPENLVASGAAAKLTHLNLAFGTVTGGQCGVGDTYAETGKVYNAASSVDGVADSTAPGTLHGIFGQFRKLKALYPSLKILWSFGGGPGSGGFSQAAQNPAAFADSCYSLVHNPAWVGVFDGIDIDWEYPNACGTTCDTSGPSAYPNLISAVRSRFGTELVTSAVTASPAKIAAGGYGTAAQYVDWYNVMSYDFFGAWATTGPTAPHSALADYSGIPTAGFSTQGAITAYRNLGVPAAKLLMGVGFYGRGWTGVTQAAPGGSATGPAAGTYEVGVEDYRILAVTCPPTGTVGGTAYGSCGSNWWSYDTPTTLAAKMQWAKSQGLGGAFAWELSSDTGTGALVSALYDNH